MCGALSWWQPCSMAEYKSHRKIIMCLSSSSKLYKSNFSEEGESPKSDNVGQIWQNKCQIPHNACMYFKSSFGWNHCLVEFSDKLSYTQDKSPGFL